MTFAHLLRPLMALAMLACAVPAAAATYTDAKRGFAIDYPDGWKVDPNYLDKGYAYFQGEREDVHEGVAFTPAADLAPGTTLQSDQLVLLVQRARPADTCNARAFLMDAPPDYFTQTVVDRPEAVQTTAQAGDLYTIEHVVVMVAKSPCLAVHYIIVSGKSGKPFDHAALMTGLNKIAGTIRPVK
jgi:hypothetical protein